MGTYVRSELSGRNKYHIGRHRFYELQHFCRQYSEWKRARAEAEANAYSSSSVICAIGTEQSISPISPVENVVQDIISYTNKIDMIEKTAADTSPELSNYILIAVTEGYSYSYLKAKLNIPCCKDVYYEMFRRFFYLLDKARN